MAGVMAAVLAAPSLAHAQGKPVYVTGGAGHLDFQGDKFDPGPTLQLEVMPGLRGPAEGALRSPDTPPPLTGGPALQGGGAVGLGIQLPVGESFTFTPSFALGRGDSRIDTGAGTEYRSGATLSYQFSNDWRLGASIYHYTDGRPTSDKEDSGMLNFTFTVPIGR